MAKTFSLEVKGTKKLIGKLKLDFKGYNEDLERELAVSAFTEIESKIKMQLPINTGNLVTSYHTMTAGIKGAKSTTLKKSSIRSGRKTESLILRTPRRGEVIVGSAVSYAQYIEKYGGAKSEYWFYPSSNGGGNRVRAGGGAEPPNIVRDTFEKAIPRIMRNLERVRIKKK